MSINHEMDEVNIDSNDTMPTGSRDDFFEKDEDQRMSTLINQ
jgi:hypothetical protein